MDILHRQPLLVHMVQLNKVVEQAGNSCTHPHSSSGMPHCSNQSRLLHSHNRDCSKSDTGYYSRSDTHRCSSPGKLQQCHNHDCNFQSFPYAVDLQCHKFAELSIRHRWLNMLLSAGRMGAGPPTPATNSHVQLWLGKPHSASRHLNYRRDARRKHWRLQISSGCLARLYPNAFSLPLTDFATWSS